MSNFVPKKDHLREVLIHYFILKKTAAQTYRILVEAYGEHAPSQDTCERWFNRFKTGDFDVKDKAKGKPPKKFEDAVLQALLDEDSTQTQSQLAEVLNVTQKSVSERLHAMGKIQKEGKWVPHDLTERQMENRKVTSELLLKRHQRKSFLYRIVTGDEKWIYFENPKRRKSIQANHQHRLQDQIGKKTILCVWWDQKGVMNFSNLVKRLMLLDNK